jgi:diaminopimelate decarboxylase
MNNLKEKHGAIHAKILKIGKEHNLPFYLYETDKIVEQCRCFTQIPYPYKSIHFATMANVNPEFLKIIRMHGMKVFVNSLQHLKIVLDTGFKPEDIIYTASALDKSTMQHLYNQGIYVNLDSLHQLELWHKMAPTAPYGIRCNIGDRVQPRKTPGGYFIGQESRLGLVREEIIRLKGCPEITGLHLYVGTDILDVAYFLDCYKVLLELVPLFPHLTCLDFGGGFGISDHNPAETFDFTSYGQQVSGLMQKASHTYQKQFRLILEPGRIIGGTAGYFVCRVTDIKQRNGEQLIGVNASSVQFPRPLFYPDTAVHPVELWNLKEEHNLRINQPINNQLVPSAIYGCSTYSRDYLAKNLLLPEARPGDLVVFGNAGSYCASSYTEFLGFPRPAEFFV